MADRSLPEIDRNPFSPAAQAIETSKRFSTPAARAAAAEDLARLHTDGYIILNNVLDADKVAEIRAEFARLHDGVPTGVSEFGGRSTQRLYNLVARTRVLDDLYLHPRVLALVEAHLDDQIQLSIASSVNLLPGETAQAFHRDDGYYPLARPHQPLSMNSMWAIDDFTAANGATLVIPGSHRIADPEPAPDATVIRAEMPAGSVMLWDGSLFHAGGTNATEQARLGITVIYCRAWLRQQENQFLGVPPAVARDLSRPLQKLIGYWVANNFLGYVNEASPREFLR